MTLVPVPIGPQSDRARSKQGGGAMITNGYIERTEGGKTAYSINTRPRLKLFSTLPVDAPCRGAIYVNNHVYVVAGETLWKVAGGGVAVMIGTVLGQKYVIMSVNRAALPQITITADTRRYICQNDVLAEIADTDLPLGVTSNDFLNGRTVFGISDGRYYWSDNNNSGAVDALNFAESERSSDQGVRVFTYGEDIWHFGTKSREIIRFTGNTESLFEPLLGAGQGDGDGCAAPFSVANVNGIVHWVNDNFQVVQSTGGRASPTSTEKIERDIEDSVNVGRSNEISGFGLIIQGHTFYCLRGPSWCWLLDTDEGIWTAVKSYGSQTFRCGLGLSAFGKSLAFDVTTGKIYEWAYDVDRDDGEDCILELIAGPLNAFPEGYICNALHVDMQRGTGTLSGGSYATDPNMMLNVSRDGGMTYGMTLEQPMGARGMYATEARFNRLGKAGGAGMTFKLTISAPVERAVMQVTADLTRTAR